MAFFMMMTKRSRSMLEGEGGIDSKSSHVGSNERVVKLGSSEHKIDLTFKFKVFINSS